MRITAGFLYARQGTQGDAWPLHTVPAAPPGGATTDVLSNMDAACVGSNCVDAPVN